MPRASRSSSTARAFAANPPAGSRLEPYPADPAATAGNWADSRPAHCSQLRPSLAYRAARGAWAHTAADTAFLSLHHPVVHRVAGIDLPAESLSIKSAEVPRRPGPDTSNHATGSAMIAPSAWPGQQPGRRFLAPR